jgi:hypothetical protein
MASGTQGQLTLFPAEKQGQSELSRLAFTGRWPATIAPRQTVSLVAAQALGDRRHPYILVQIELISVW